MTLWIAAAAEILISSGGSGSRASLIYTYLRVWEQIHEFTHKEGIVAVVSAQVSLQQGEVLCSLFPLLSLLTEVWQHIHIVFDPLVDALQVYR